MPMTKSFFQSRIDQQQIIENALSAAGILILDIPDFQELSIEKSDKMCPDGNYIKTTVSILIPLPQADAQNPDTHQTLNPRAQTKTPSALDQAMQDLS